MLEMTSHLALGQSSERADQLFKQHQQEIYRETDQLFAKVLISEWAACMIIAAVMSGRTWEGNVSQIHIHVWISIFLGGAVSLFPLWLTRVFPGAAVTRHVIAAAQMLMSALLIGLTGGRIETHFHIFGSLVILSFYRDWRVLIPATLVVMVDHFVRGIYWPYSMYGALSASPLRSLEHTGWVIFEDVFLIISCLRSVQEMHFIANRTADLEASEREARLIFEKAPIGMAVIGLDNQFEKANAALCEMTGYSPEELAERTTFDITFAEDLERSKASARTMLGGAARSVIEKRYVRKNGDLIQTSRTACAVCDEHGKPLHFLHMVEDITDRKRAEDALRQSKHDLEAALEANQLIMDNSQDVICTMDAEGNFVTVNPACEGLWGYTPANLIGRSYTEFVHPDDVAKTKAAWAKAQTGERIADFVNRYVRNDAAVVDVLWSVSWSESEKLMFCVAHDVTERARIEKELREAKEDADRANHAKSEFLSRMSHELRTPLNAILGFGQLLERQNPTDSQRTRVRYIISAGRHLLNLINEVLDISRIEAGNLQLSLEPVSVGETLHEALDLMRPLAADRNIELAVTTSLDSSCYVQADRQRLKQVLLNLFTNAVKYTPMGGKVTVSDSFVGKNGLRLVVSDTGPGIPVEKLSRLFTPFDRLGAEQTGVEGTGLGLALCQRLVHAMGGTVGANSTAGTGSTFWVELPLTQSPLERLADQITMAHDRGNLGDSERRKILYIEDNLSNLTLIEQMLADEPAVELITAMQGRIGLDLARQHLPDLILLDLHLPDIPGWEVLEHLKRDKVTHQIPVIVISADATSRQIERLMQAGARAYLTKPLDMGEFYRVVAETKADVTDPLEPVAA